MHKSDLRRWGQQYNLYSSTCIVVENTFACMAGNAEKLTVDLKVDNGRDDNDDNIDCKNLRYECGAGEHGDTE